MFGTSIDSLKHNLSIDTIHAQLRSKLARYGAQNPKGDDSEETDRRIFRQKQEFETLYRQYQNELKAKEFKRKDEDVKQERRIKRESRIQAIRERKFQDEL